MRLQVLLHKYTNDKQKPKNNHHLPFFLKNYNQIVIKQALMFTKFLILF